MNDAMQPQCPRIDDISALIDDALAGPTRDEMTAHAAVCSVCGAMLRQFRATSAGLQELPEVRCEADVAALIEVRLAPRPPARAVRKPTHGRVWHLAPRGLAAAGVLAAGVYFGLMLAGGGAVTVMRPAAVQIFDAVPPGALCAGQAWCGPGAR
jgi:anti-sigma factor RsiW